MHYCVLLLIVSYNYPRRVVRRQGRHTPAMLIPVESDVSDNTRIWAMIELQGEVERKDGGTLQDAFDVGTLSTPPTGSGVVLTVGYHRIEGTTVPLTKPLAILDKDAADNLKYKVVGVVREKYLFKTRPRALITKPDERNTKG